jgi:hypothetical protein
LARFTRELTWTDVQGAEEVKETSNFRESGERASGKMRGMFIEWRHLSVMKEARD